MDEWEEFWEEFVAVYGSGEQYKAFKKKDRTRLKKNIPDWLLDLWENHGWAGYGAGLFWSVDPDEYRSLVDLWKPPEGEAFPVARTAFGTIYLLQPFVEEGRSGLSVVKIGPHTREFSVPGPSAKMFLTEEVAEPKYRKKVFWEPDVKRAIKKLGPLAPDEMYSFDPPLAKGGSGKPNTVVKVNLFEEHKRLAKFGKLKFVKY